MWRLAYRHRLYLLLAVSFFGFFTTSCQANAAVTYKPPFLPITFAIDTAGNISIQGDLSIVTEVGEFGVQGSASTSFQPTDQGFLLIIRHLKDNVVVDTGYQINTDQEVVVVVDGKTTIRVTQKEVFIDATSGTIRSITVAGADNQQSGSTDDQPAPTATPPPLTIQSFTVDNTSVPNFNYVNFSIGFNRPWDSQDEVSLKLYDPRFPEYLPDCSNQGSICTFCLIANGPLTATFAVELDDLNQQPLYTFPSTITINWYYQPTGVNTPVDYPCRSATGSEIEPP